MQFSCLKVDDAVGILHDRAVRRTRLQASGIGAVHALILAHQPLDRPVFALVLVELDQIPEVPARLRHRLVGVVEVVGVNGMSFHSTHATSQALQPMQVVVSTSLQTSNSRCSPVPGERARHGPRSFRFAMSAALAHRRARSYAFSIFTRKPLNSGVYAFGSITVGVSRFASVFAVLPSSSAMPRKPQ